MTPIPIGAFIGESLGQVRRVLFSPFSPSRWLRLMLIALLAGSLTGGCGLQSLRGVARQPNRSAPTSASERTSEEGGDPRWGRAADAARSRHQFVDSIFRPDPSTYPSISPLWAAVVLLPLLAALLLGVLAFWFFWIWLSVRFKFMWLRAVNEGESGIRALFVRCRSEAEDLFDFWLGFSALEAVSYGLVFAWIIGVVFAAGGGWDSRIEWTPAVAWSVVGPPVGALGVVWAVFSIGRTVGNDFLVPLTLRRPGSSRAVWSRWIEIYRRARVRVWGYLALRVLLGFVWGVLQAAAIVALLLAGGLAAAACVALSVWAARTLALPGPVRFLYAALVGIPLAAALAAAVGAVLLPGAVFFRDFSLRVLNRLDAAEP